MSNLNIVELPDYRDVISTAMEDAINTSGKPLAMSLFRQGNRDMLSGSLPFSYVRDLLVTNSAKKNSSVKELREATNRPMITEHARDIGKYIRENLAGNYTLGALTLNISRPLNFYTIKSSSDTRTGYLVLPHSSKVDITDGQHRTDAIKIGFNQMTEDELTEFNRQSIAVVVTAESDIKQIHQDFADASKTKQLPAAMLTAFDMRNPANRIVLLLEEKCPLFDGLVDATSKSLSKKSKMLFTANHLRQFVKVTFTGSWQIGSASFDEKASEIFNSVDEFEAKLTKITDYINYLVTVIPVWQEIAKLNRNTEVSRLLEIRNNSPICVTPTGLVIIARIAYEVFYKYAQQIEARGETWQTYADRLGTIDWSRDADMWKNNICQPDAKGIMRVLQQQNLIRQAIVKVREVIGLTELDAKKE